MAKHSSSKLCLRAHYTSLLPGSLGASMDQAMPADSDACRHRERRLFDGEVVCELSMGRWQQEAGSPEVPGLLHSTVSVHVEFIFHINFRSFLYSLDTISLSVICIAKTFLDWNLSLMWHMLFSVEERF